MLPTVQNAHPGKLNGRRKYLGPAGTAATARGAAARAGAFPRGADLPAGTLTETPFATLTVVPRRELTVTRPTFADAEMPLLDTLRLSPLAILIRLFTLIPMTGG